MSMCVYIYTNLSIYLFIYLFFYLFICLSVYIIYIDFCEFLMFVGYLLLSTYQFFRNY